MTASHGRLCERDHGVDEIAVASGAIGTKSSWVFRIGILLFLVFLIFGQLLDVFSDDRNNGVTSNNKASSHNNYVYGLTTPEQAAANLQNQTWVDRLQIRELQHIRSSRMRMLGSVRDRRIIEWSVMSHPTPAAAAATGNIQGSVGVDFFLKPSAARSTKLIDLFLHGRVSQSMGENMVMLGWAKVALALGCRRVVMFASDVDFIHYVNRAEQQVYIMDYKSLTKGKDELLVDEILTQRTWELAYWGRSARSIKNKLNLPADEYGFKPDHAMVPYNYSAVPADNVRVGVLPTAITMSHIHDVRRTDEASSGHHQRCDAFFMGKRAEHVESLKPLIKNIEEKLLLASISNPSPRHDNVTICTGMKLPKGVGLDKYLGFSVNFTVNLGITKPAVFADMVGAARVVIGSGSPNASPTITDTIFGGGVFMAPAKQFMSMEDHPLFERTDEAFHSLEEQADEIVRLILEETDDEQERPFGGFKDTSYTIEHVCRQVLMVIKESELSDTV
mmetsp:Transcript_1848/g.3983  ORF Transcript_1848/g.3983 Transcript_1848/m.3983 type:complete len:504 (-) Transcript_1848:43-1554(-)